MYTDAILIITAVLLFVFVDSTPDNKTIEIVNSTARAGPIIDLRDLGFDGSWNDFCYPKNINEEFSYFPEHELKKLRVLLCHIWEENKFDLQARAVSAVYKYCVIVSTLLPPRFTTLL